MATLGTRSAPTTSNQLYAMSVQAVAHLSKDPILAPILERVVPEPIQADGDVYAGLTRSIIYQQLSGKAAGTIHGRFLNLFEDGYPHAAQLLGQNQETLRSVGLSKQKATYLHEVARFFQAHHPNGHNWSEWTDEAIVKHLTQIKGVGEWTVQMILIFTLARPDVFPTGDLAIQQAMTKAYGLPGKGRALKERMRTTAEQWRPYRSYATRCLWQWMDTRKK